MCVYGVDSAGPEATRTRARPLCGTQGAAGERAGAARDACDLKRLPLLETWSGAASMVAQCVFVSGPSVGCAVTADPGSLNADQA